MNARRLIALYPRRWRERYGEEFLLMLGHRVRRRDVVDVISGAANEWMAIMTGVNRWNDQAQRTTLALAQAAGFVIAVRTLVPPIATALFGVPMVGSSNLGLALLFGFVSSLLQCAVTLGPVALLAAITPWYRISHARMVAGVAGALVAARIASLVAWGPLLGMLVIAGFWVGYRTVCIEHQQTAEI